ncbi:MAG TPA: hypothetical protein DCG57_10080, partial [Candidatus Riflebacteria bacterium]|nr:hypothetical protein [Candidatus Riflebacteria bacterium]
LRIEIARSHKRRLGRPSRFDAKAPVNSRLMRRIAVALGSRREPGISSMRWIEFFYSYVTKD